MNRLFVATAAFGLEGLAAAELRRMGIPAKAEQGGARFEATLAQAFQANLWLRTADRVLMVLCERETRSFEALFQAVSAIPWETLLPRDAALPVTGKCARSQLMSVRDCQAIAKKAIVKRLQTAWRVERLPESGERYPIDVSIHKDIARVTLDMSGDALNRRGYRTWNGEAPLRETLAAALIELSPWRPGMPLYDPCCGTGTLLIEAAMKATGRAPGLNRTFACERFRFMPKEELARARQEAKEAYRPDAPMDIGGGDIDPEAVELCRRHIEQAGYAGRIGAKAEDLRNVQLTAPAGVFVCNPPYGERLGDRKSCAALYRELGALQRRHPGWSLCAISADPAFERAFGRRATRKRRLYNGRLECDYYVFDAGGAPVLY